MTDNTPEQENSLQCFENWLQSKISSSLEYAAKFKEMDTFRAILQKRMPDIPEFFAICEIPKLKKEYFKLLVESGVNLHAINEHGQNALFMAAESGNLVLLRSLLDAGLNPMQCDDTGEIALSVALRCDNLSVAECLLDVTKNPASIIDKQGENLLHKAAWGDMASMAKKLINDYHVDVEGRDNAGHTPLHVAAYQGSNKMVRYILTEANANINAIDHEGRTPVFSGAYDTNLRALKFLCEQGADLTWKDNTGITALQFAARKNQFKAEKLLKSNLGMYRPKRPQLLVAEQPEKCPFCSSLDIRPIIYGMPGPDFDFSKYLSGGCCRADDSPSWGCRNCHAGFIEKK